MGIDTSPQNGYIMCRFNNGVKVIRCIKAYKWSEELQDFVEIPLDAADSWIIEMNRRFAGTDITSVQLVDLLEREGWPAPLTP